MEDLGFCSLRIPEGARPIVRRLDPDETPSQPLVEGPTTRRWLTEEGMYLAVALVDVPELGGELETIDLENARRRGAVATPPGSGLTVSVVDVPGADAARASIGPMLASTGEVHHLLTVVARRGRESVVLYAAWARAGDDRMRPQALAVAKSVRVDRSAEGIAAS